MLRWMMQSSYLSDHLPPPPCRGSPSRPVLFPTCPDLLAAVAPARKGCWNVAVRCCGSACDVPWAESTGGCSASGDDLADQTSSTKPEGRRNQLLVLAPAFFKVGAGCTEAV